MTAAWGLGGSSACGVSWVLRSVGIGFATERFLNKARTPPSAAAGGADDGSPEGLLSWSDSEEQK